MDFDEAKENIQPLAQGRNASILHASLKVESSQELLAQRLLLEKQIHNYSGDDPLSVWYNYVEWIEQSFPSGGKESGLQEVLSKCLSKFESDDRYKQDRRMVKLYIKFIDNLKDPAECYQQLYSAGIGTMVADFYIAWAYCYDLIGNTRMADEIFLRGIACRAQPLEELQEARQHFGFSVAQRLMYKDDDSIRKETDRQLYERRTALTSLKAHRRKQVGSVRTGSAVKSFSPGTIKADLPSTSSQRGSARVIVFNDENESTDAIFTPSNDPDSINEVGKSVVRSIIDAARNQENRKEPGPWNNTHKRKKGKLFVRSTITSDLGFEIHEDVYEDKQPCIPPIPIADCEIKYNKPFNYPPYFCAYSKPIKGWITPVTTEEMPDVNTLPEYNKCKLYPRKNMEFQPEELRAYKILKERCIENEFTKERDEYWGCGPKYNIRLYPHFATKSKPQTMDSMDQFFIPEKISGLQVFFEEIYKKDDKVERQFEEILALHIKRNKTNIEIADMEETMCTASEKVQRRKSFFPLRKSLAPTILKNSNKMPNILEQKEKYETIATVSDLSSNALICSEAAKVVDNKVDETPAMIDKNSNQKETSRAESLFNDEKYHNFLIKKTSTRAELESNVSNIVLPKVMEIFEDDTSVETDGIQTVKNDNYFQFKTPKLPITNLALSAAVSHKLPFEIFDDENLEQKSPNSIPKIDFNCGTDEFFDPEETCSTQTFNIFLKAQSVSTPKAVLKCKPQKNFGNILKEVTPPIIPDKDELNDNQNCNVENQNYTPEVPPVAADSPPRQQLSTILETSEHGTTQGTHTTGATTKSTLSSPEFELDSQAQSIANAGANQAQTVLETVKELRYEDSAVVKPLNIQNMDRNVSGAQNLEEKIETPSTRLQNKCVPGTGGLNFSIFEDSIINDNKKVGNFSRFEEKEDTAIGSVFKTLPSIHFQDDKTETISKMLVNSQQVKFQDDKTETISKMMFEPQIPNNFQENKTEGISKILMDPPQPIQFPEDKTETLPTFRLEHHELVKFEDEKSMDLRLIEKEKIQQDSTNKDDSFEFFRRTPPKPVKHVRSTANSHTPLTLEAKRFCDKDMPGIPKTKSLFKNVILFEDEFQPHLENKCVSNMKNNMKDSFLLDFSLNEKNQQVVTQSKIKHKSKSVLRDSFIPDFSVIEDSQPQTKQVQLENEHKMVTESEIPDHSFIRNSQHTSTEPGQNKSRKLSILSDFFHIPETKNNESIIKSSQSVENEHLQQSSRQISILKNYSKDKLEEKKIDDINWKQNQNIIHSNVSQKSHDGSILKNIMMDTFMKDFSDINEPPARPGDIKQVTFCKPVQDSEPPATHNENKQVTLCKPVQGNSTLRFLNESLKHKSSNPRNIEEYNSNIDTSSSSKEKNLNFLTLDYSKEKIFNKKECLGASNNDKYFELNCETEMFGTNISMIKNSTWLPNHGPSVSGYTKQLSQILEKSLHIKSEDVSANSLNVFQTQNQELNPEEPTKSKLSFNKKPVCKNDFGIEICTADLAAINDRSFANNKDNPIVILDSPEINQDDNEMSIYYKQTPKTPKLQVHIWDDADTFKTTAQTQYLHTEVDFNQTNQLIENICVNRDVNPFNVDLINAFIEQHDVITYIESLPTCKLVGCIQRLRQNVTIDINGNVFNVIKLIGEGAYGAVFCGKETGTCELVAMKQEKPPNFWEYYICLEIRVRIKTDEMVSAYMSVDYALIGNNSSILISKFSQYGSLITVCNKIKKHTLKNLDEYVVMLLSSELLEIMDHLHAANIIHADVKADNFLLMNKLTYPPTERHLQLIDFGVSIDMQLFKEGQTFSFVHNDNTFKCPEMRERRPWSYQLDLYGLAGVIHVLLFGKYMDIEKKARGFWMHKTHVPRYFNKNLWDEIFKTLLNIRDCNSMPNLQDLRALLKKELEEKDKYVLKMVNEFNRALSA